MLVPFAIDPGCLDFDPAWAEYQRLDYQKSVLDIWEKIGLLCHSGASLDASHLMKAIESLPQKYRDRWFEALMLPNIQGRDDWDGSIGSGNLNMLSGHASVALVDDARALEEFCFSDEELSKPNALSTGVEVCRFSTANKAESFSKALSRSVSHIEPEDSYGEIWKERFRNLAVAQLKRISIVDRFAVSRHFERPQSQLSGIARFLRLLDNDCSGPRYVSLFSAWTKDLLGNIVDIENEFKSVMAKLPKQNVKQLKIVMSPNSTFSELAHDRFIRFEDYIWDIGLGLQIFEGPCVGHRSAATLKAGKIIVGEYRDEVEQYLLKNAASKECKIYG